jgi:hypothetical protein
MMPKKTNFQTMKILQVRINPDTREKLESLLSRHHKTMASIVVKGIDLVHAQHIKAEADAKQIAAQSTTQ